MKIDSISRRLLLKHFGSAAAVAACSGTQAGATLFPSVHAQTAAQTGSPADAEQASRAQRMQWWHAAKFGMFIHWGLYSVLGQHEWAMEVEGIPIPQYELLARHFHPKPNAAREWARLARRAGQKYMVMTTKHHEGFCMFDTKLTNYCAPSRGRGGTWCGSMLKPRAPKVCAWASIIR